MSEDMRLKDFRPKTRDAYWRAVRQFLQHVKKGAVRPDRGGRALLSDPPARRENAGPLDSKHRSARTALLLHLHLPAGLAGPGLRARKDPPEAAECLEPR